MTSGASQLRFSLSLYPKPLICLWQGTCVGGPLVVPVLEAGRRVQLDWCTQVRIANWVALPYTPWVHRWSLAPKGETRQPCPQTQKSLESG